MLEGFIMLAKRDKRTKVQRDRQILYEDSAALNAKRSKDLGEGRARHILFNWTDTIFFLQEHFFDK